jgi:hypothetical protein
MSTPLTSANIAAKSQVASAITAAHKLLTDSTPAVVLQIPAGITTASWGTRFLPFHQTFVAAQTASYALGYSDAARAQLAAALFEACGNDGNAIELESTQTLLEDFFGTAIELVTFPELAVAL